MQDGKVKCDCCGNLVREKYISRLAFQKYIVRTCSCIWETKEHYNICDDCVITVKNLMKGSKK